jgi:hypothetical protein
MKMKPENTCTIYYMDKNGKVQDGENWLHDYKFEEIEKKDLQKLKECHWCPQLQRWMRAEN